MIPLTDDSDLWKRHFKLAEMVIEAVPEILDLKHKWVDGFNLEHVFYREVVEIKKN